MAKKKIDVEGLLTRLGGAALVFMLWYNLVRGIGDVPDELIEKEWKARQQSAKGLGGTRFIWS